MILSARRAIIHKIRFYNSCNSSNSNNNIFDGGMTMS